MDDGCAVAMGINESQFYEDLNRQHWSLADVRDILYASDNISLAGLCVSLPSVLWFRLPILMLSPSRVKGYTCYPKPYSVIIEHGAYKGDK